MSDLIDRQAAIDDIWTVSPLAHLDREWIDRWLRQLPPANNSETPNSSDTISRAKAIDALRRQAETMSDWSNRYAEQRKGVLTAVNIVEDLPPAQPNVHDLAKDADCISRRAAITALSNEIVKRRLLDEMYDGCIDEFQTEEILKKLPPAPPQRIKGRWIPVGGALYQCDQCGVVSLKRKFCSECGADMREATT